MGLPVNSSSPCSRFQNLTGHVKHSRNVFVQPQTSVA